MSLAFILWFSAASVTRRSYTGVQFYLKEPRRLCAIGMHKLPTHLLMPIICH